MGELLREIVETNQLIIQFASGQAFFIVGLAISLRIRWHSRLALARALPALAIFGLLHGAATWGRGFIPIQARYLDPAILDVLWFFQAILMAVSLAILLHFGASIGLSARRRLARGTVEVLAVLSVVLSWWWAATNGASALDQARVAESLARYLLCFPGALLAAIGLEREAQQVARRGLPRPAAGLRYAAAAFIAFAVVGGLVAPEIPLLHASLPGLETIVEAAGIPMAIVRAACGLAIGAAIWRALEVFDAELEDTLRRARDSETRAAERLRVGQDLHDSVFQAIYGTGLMLEDVLESTDAIPDSTRDKLRTAMEELNRTVLATRAYILELGAEADRADQSARTGTSDYVVAGPDRRRPRDCPAGTKNARLTAS